MIHSLLFAICECMKLHISCDIATTKFTGFSTIVTNEEAIQGVHSVLIP